MKNIYKTILFASLFIFSGAFSQSINWSNSEPRNIFSTNVSSENSTYLGVGYAYKISNGKKPIYINAETAFSVEEKLFKDYNAKLGIQMKIFQWKDFVLSSKTNAVYSFYDADYLKLYNFGSNLSWSIGYYIPKWFASAELGYDKILNSYFKYSDSYKNQFPTVEDGCSKVYADGNFYYKLNGGYSFGNKDLTFSVGNSLNQDFRTNSNSSVYAQIGFNCKF